MSAVNSKKVMALMSKQGPFVEAIRQASRAPLEQDDTPSNATAPSLQAQIDALDVNESVAKVQDIGVQALTEPLSDVIARNNQQLRNSCSSRVARASRRSPGKSFSIELGTLLMPAGTLWTVAIITRKT